MVEVVDVVMVIAVLISGTVFGISYLKETGQWVVIRDKYFPPLSEQAIDQSQEDNSEDGVNINISSGQSQFEYISIDSSLSAVIGNEEYCDIYLRKEYVEGDPLILYCSGKNVVCKHSWIDDKTLHFSNCERVAYVNMD